MGNREDLYRLIDNLDDTHVETLGGIVSRMLSVVSEKWTGKISFELNANQGRFGDTHVNKSEIIRAKKKRGYRSSGIR